MNRNHFLMIGVVILFLGIQVHIVDTYVLSEKATKVIARRTDDQSAPAITGSRLIKATNGPDALAKKSIQPPDWLGWMLMSIGSVMVLQSFAMPKPS